MESGHRHANWQIAVLAGSVFGFLVFATCLVSTLRWGGVSQGLAWLRGEAIYMLPRVCDLGEVPVAQTVTVKIGVQNLWSTPVTVVGATSNCACTTIRGMPLELAGSGRGELSVQFRPEGNQAGLVVEQAIPVHVNVDSATPVLWIRARVTPASASSKGQP